MGPSQKQIIATAISPATPVWSFDIKLPQTFNCNCGQFGNS